MKRLLFLCFMGLVWQSCDKKTDPPIEEGPGVIQLKAASQDVISGSNVFGVDLFTAIASQEEENVMISPLSASIALTMLLNGCDGATYEQIHQMLGYSSGMSLEEVNEAHESLVNQLTTVDDKVDIRISNAIFHRADFQAKQPFMNTMTNKFDAQVEGLDFSTPAAVDYINDWANNATNGLIPKILDVIDPATVMFLMNALYFKGDWTDQFNPEKTLDRAFTLNDGSTIQVPTMNSPINALLTHGDGYRAIEMVYGRQNFSMVVIVPHQDLGAFYSQFSPATWTSITESLDAQNDQTTVEVFLPKFKFAYDKTLNDELQVLGMQDAFDSHLADLSGISDNNLVVSNVKQNTFIEVNEEGTQAAAVTTVDIVDTSANYFEANKPFIFAIRERTTNTLLFIGAVNNPTLN